MFRFLKFVFYSFGLVYSSKINNNYSDYIINNDLIYNHDSRLAYEGNVNFINTMNSKNLSYELDINQFIDKPLPIKMTNFIKTNDCHNCFTHTTNDDFIIPKSIDWRERNAVTHVKNQGDCGSCWSFSTTGALEGIHAIKKGELINASEQQLMDCSDQYGNKGCQGGLMDNAFKYVIHKGLCSEKEYPYSGEEGICQSNQCTPVVQINNYSDVESNNEKTLMRAVAHQPVSVAIQANLSSFRFYKRGVYQDSLCGDQLDHGVLIVGYGTDILQGLDYWIVKNSWTSNWGDEGYVKILRNYEKYGGDSSGMCGIAIQPSFPIIN
jgi:C1A family cysteine protease